MRRSTRIRIRALAGISFRVVVWRWCGCACWRSASGCYKRGRQQQIHWRTHNVDPLHQLRSHSIFCWKRRHYPYRSIDQDPAAAHFPILQERQLRRHQEKLSQVNQQESAQLSASEMAQIDQLILQLESSPQPQSTSTPLKAASSFTLPRASRPRPPALRFRAGPQPPLSRSHAWPSKRSSWAEPGLPPAPRPRRGTSTRCLRCERLPTCNPTRARSASSR